MVSSNHYSLKMFSTYFQIFLTSSYIQIRHVKMCPTRFYFIIAVAYNQSWCHFANMSILGYDSLCSEIWEWRKIFSMKNNFKFGPYYFRWLGNIVHKYYRLVMISFWSFLELNSPWSLLYSWNRVLCTSPFRWSWINDNRF